MNIYITLDYEIFFGAESGSAEDCILEPTTELLKIIDPHGIKIVFFVDVGYLIKLDEYKKKYDKLNSDFNKICDQIKFLYENGHGVELHVHPHWENSFYDGERWVFDTSKYKLTDFTKSEANDILVKYAAFLTKLTGKAPIAYRAGGWSAQPFSYISEALKKLNIRIDSTVFPKGYHKSNNQFYDFKNVPQYKTKYFFEDDLTKDKDGGYFTEYPISSYRLSPLFFWRFAIEKLKKAKKHLSYGNGKAINKPKKEILRLMTLPSHSVVSIDGYKASFIQKAFEKYVKNTEDNGNFVLIGHPKAFTPYSLMRTKKFIEQNVFNHNFKIFTN